ncbi:MAG TPA: hypothetical protein OIL81_00845 [Coriobacteriaceae bacterium]|nr:hypothetical protein [Coriobacteriaceae bacterium]
MAKVVCSGGYFEFLRRRAAAAVIPRPAAAIPASAIALGAVSPVFASLPAVVSACLPLLEFACLVELGRASLPVAGEATGGVASAGCVEPEGGVVIGRLSFFQIVEERISPGCELVDMAFIFLYGTFTVINSSFLISEAELELAELRFAMAYLRFCRYDLTAQLPYILFGNFDKLLVAECFECLKHLKFLV